MPRTSKTPERANVGALVFLFSQSDGQFGLVSYDRRVEVWGQSLDAIWPRYFTKAKRAMRKHERETAAQEAANRVPAGKSFDIVPTSADAADGFVEV